MPKPKSPYQFDAEEYVHVVTHLGETVTGMYDGVLYTFEEGVPSDPIHWQVAHHIFGYMGTDAARMNAVLRRAWCVHVSAEIALRMLKTQVQFQPMNPFPKGVVEFRRPEAPSDAEPGTPTPEASVGEGAPAIRAATEPASPDPFHDARGSRSKKSG